MANEAPELTEGEKTAFMIAANEVFFENVTRAVEDAGELLESGDLGATYQGFHRGLLDAETAAARLDSLEAWVTAPLVRKVLARAQSSSAADFGCDLVDEVTLAAGIDLAEAVLLIALGRDGEVEPAVQPYLAHIRALAARLTEKIASHDTNEEEDVAASFA